MIISPEIWNKRKIEELGQTSDALSAQCSVLIPSQLVGVATRPVSCEECGMAGFITVETWALFPQYNGPCHGGMTLIIPDEWRQPLTLVWQSVVQTQTVYGLGAAEARDMFTWSREIFHFGDRLPPRYVRCCGEDHNRHNISVDFSAVVAQPVRALEVLARYGVDGFVYSFDVRAEEAFEFYKKNT